MAACLHVIVLSVSIPLHGVLCCMSVQTSVQLSPRLLSCLLSCGQALERQKEYFDCIRNERDELRDELADIKGKSRGAEVGSYSRQPGGGSNQTSASIPSVWSSSLSGLLFLQM